MRKLTVFLFVTALVFALNCEAFAAEFEPDDKAVITGMDGRSWYQGYTPSVRYDNFTLCLPVRSEGAVGPITATITLEDPDLLLFRDTPQAVTVYPRDGIYPVKLTVPLSQKRQNGDYAAKILISGRNENEEAITREFPYVIRIRDGKKNPETLIPKLSLSGDLTVGQDCLLTLSVSNPTASLSMTECSLTLTDPAGEVLMSGSNRMTLPEILPGQTAQAEIPVTVKGNAAVELHSLSLKLTYRVLEEETVWEETVTCPVTQKIRLEQGEITLPPSAIAGELTTLSVPLMNMGKGDILNVLVSLEIPGLIQKQSVLVGTLEPGATGQAKLTFTPAKDAPGDYSGTVTFACEDAYGNETHWSSPVSITVEAAKPVAETPKGEEKASAPAWLLPAMCVLSAALAAGLLLQGVLLRSKLHRLEEERL